MMKPEDISASFAMRSDIDMLSLYAQQADHRSVLAGHRSG